MCIRDSYTSIRHKSAKHWSFARKAIGLHTITAFEMNFIKERKVVQSFAMTTMDKFSDITKITDEINK